MKNKVILILLSILIFSGCQGNKLNTPKETKLTVGVVQKEIKNGMTQADVASVLGSPNIVTREQENKEIWIYDKISSTVDYAKSGQYGTLVLLGANSENGTVKSSQKTLTIIIKFEKGKVYEYKYNSTSF